MPGGFGSSPFGAGPYGWGTPAGAPEPADQLYLDPSSGIIGTGRKIDPATRQYAYDAFGRYAGQETVPQLVYLAFATVKGSSILSDLGETYSKIDVIGDSFTKDVEDQARAAVQSLVDQKKLEIKRVVVQRLGESAATIQVYWRDLTTGLEGATTI